MVFQKIHSRLHVWIQDQKFMGLEIGSRMTVIDLDGRGTLFVHSPIALTPEIKSQLDNLGRVSFVVAPNKWHHLYISDFQKAFPDAKFFCAPGLEKKRSDLKFDGILNDVQGFPWNPSIEHKIIFGAPLFNEVAFFHQDSRSLILTDTALHICETSSLKTKLTFLLMGTFGKFGLSRLEKLLFIKNKEQFRASMENVAQWDFDRIILCHGQILESGGKKEFAKAYLEEAR